MPGPFSSVRTPHPRTTFFANVMLRGKHLIQVWVELTGAIDQLAPKQAPPPHGRAITNGIEPGRRG